MVKGLYSAIPEHVKALKEELDIICVAPVAHSDRSIENRPLILPSMTQSASRLRKTKSQKRHSAALVSLIYDLQGKSYCNVTTSVLTGGH